MSPLPYDDLAGVLYVCPGQRRPHTLVSSRRDWAAWVTRGLPAADLATKLGGIFSLCAHSHRLCADMAVAAARGLLPTDHLTAGRSLQHETLREHVRRIGLDWPRQLAPEPAFDLIRERALAALQSCPLFHSVTPSPSGALSGEVSAELLTWLEAQLLNMPARQWLARWEDAAAAWLRTWSTQAEGWLPLLMQQSRSIADKPRLSAPSLRVHGSMAELTALAADMSQPDFTRQPIWRGQCAETGTWTRLREPNPDAFDTPWLMLGSRLAELVRLSLPDEPDRTGASWLSMGSLSPGLQEGVAWVEMARGLLIHHVQLNGDGEHARVAACHVLAPTEWNFHPQGAVAQALEAFKSPTTPRVCREIDLLISAYDPCVKYQFLTDEELAPGKPDVTLEEGHA